MLFFYLALLAHTFILNVTSMPYSVPLQGVVGGKRTLVLLDDLDKTSLYSLFFNDLSTRGHSLSFLQADSPKLQLKSFGESLYDNIILFAPTVDRLGSITFNDIVEFSNEGGNVVVAANRDVSDSVRDFIETFGIVLDKKGSEVIDHFSSLDSVDISLQHTHILARNSIPSSVVLGKYAELASPPPVLFHGIGHTVADAQNILAVKVLQGNPTTYSAAPNKAVNSNPESAGAQTLLVSAIQGRNNARIVVSGSLDMFSNAYFGASVAGGSSTGNRLFWNELSKWGFGETGVLRFRDITHRRSDGVPPDVILHEKVRPDLPQSLYPDPELTRNSLVYRIKDEIVYHMVVEQYKDAQWQPFAADDMQMEFVMLDPYVRKTMTSDPATGLFSVTFIAPDSYGIFKFRVLYRREGYSVLHAETQVSIRPFKHNEYERFIFSAYPYYSSAISATVAFFVFSVCFLFSSEKQLKQ